MTHSQVSPVNSDHDLSETKGNMVFHAPFPIDRNSSSASGIRPWKMLEAFKNIGYEVLPITGYARERRRRFSHLKEFMDRGGQIDFVYSEAATIPSSFTEPRHVPLVPFLDRKIFRYFSEARIKSGVFYRDVYWAFPEYENRVGRLAAAAMKSLYRQEISTFNKYVDVLFVPSNGMVDYIPGLNIPTVALPPGGDEPDQEAAQEVHAGPELNLLYVGALDREHYDVGELLAAVGRLPSVSLTICTRPDQLQAAMRDYPALKAPNIKVVHKSGRELLSLYNEADVACLTMRPQEYRSFAAPMKLYEYLAMGKPILVSADTHSARVVAEANAGWAVPFNAEAIAAQLALLQRDGSEIARAANEARQFAGANTWQARASAAAAALRPD